MRSPFHFVAACAAVTLLVGATAPAQAQQPADPNTPQAFGPPDPTLIAADEWTFTPFVGFGFGGELENSPLALGAAAAYNWSSRWAFEGELGILPGGSAGDFFEVDTTVWSLTANAIYHFAGNDRVVPYGAFGLGVINGSADMDELDLIDDELIDGSDTALAVNFGGGIRTRLAEQAQFRADLRYVNGDDLAPSHWRLYAGLTFPLGR
jgi:opacity protein-like surface antigen